MNTYRVLNKQVYTLKDYSLVPIRMKDRYNIMKWRNEQIYHLRQAELLTKEKQDWYFDNVVANLFDQEKPSQLLFSLLKADECIGYGGLVHINWIDKHSEISFLMDTEHEKNRFDAHWKVYLKLLERVAFKELGLHRIFTYAFDLRPHLYRVFENANFVQEARLKDHVLYRDRYVDVVIHGKINT